MSITLDIFVLPFHQLFSMLIYCPLPPVLVVVSGPFLLWQFSWMSFSGSFQIILPTLLLWMMVCHLSSCCIIHAPDYFMGALIILVYWIFGTREKYPPALIIASGSDMQDASRYIWRIILPIVYSGTASGYVALQLKNGLIYFSVSIVVFVCTATNEFSDMNFLWSM